MVERLHRHLGGLYPIIRAPVSVQTILLLIQLPANAHSQRQQLMAQVLGTLSATQWETWMEFLTPSFSLQPQLSWALRRKDTNKQMEDEFLSLLLPLLLPLHLSLFFFTVLLSLSNK